MSRVFPLLALLAAFALTVAGGASAQSMRAEIYENLSDAEEAAEAGDFEAAFEKLEKAEKKRDRTDYENAQIWTAYGFIRYMQKDYDGAIQSYEKILALEDLTDGLRLGTLYTLAQLQFQTEQYDRAVGHLERWLAESPTNGPEPLVLLGQGYYQLERYRDAVDPIEKAIALAQQKGRPVEESWYSLLRAVWYELEEYDRVADVLEILVTQYPSKEYWVQLAAMYHHTGAEERQLAAYEIANAQGYLEREAELVRFAQLLLQAKAPWRAGDTLQRGLDAGIVEPTEDNWRLLSQAWTLAREDEAAVIALRESAALSNDGELDARLAQAHLNLADWEAAVAAADVALEKGVDDADEVHLIRGMALYELDRFGDAKSAFRIAQRSEDSAGLARQWIRAIESEQNRLSELRRSMTP